MDDPWSADPDESFKTPRLADAGIAFSSISINDTTPTAPAAGRGEGGQGAVEEEQTPHASVQASSSYSADNNGINDDARKLTSRLPRLNLEAIIDQHHQQQKRDSHTAAHQLEGTNGHSNNGSNNGNNVSTASSDDDEPDTARPVVSRSGSTSQQSPDLHILASMYRPEETQLTVADSAGYFESVNLATPTIEKFESMDGGSRAWPDNNSGRQGSRGQWDGSGFSFQSPRRSGMDKDPSRRKSKSSQVRNASGFGHRKTASDASAASASSEASGSNSRRASWLAGPSASTPTFTYEPDSFHPSGSDLDSYNRRASSSSSSIADSVGTAGEAPDSDYEDARSKSHSRQGSRRPSVSENPGLGKRLSSFAPIPSLKHTPSQTDLSDRVSAQQHGHTNGSASGSAVVSPQTSPPAKGKSPSAPQRQSTDQTMHTTRDMSREASSQSATSSASADSAGPSSQSQSRISSSGPVTYSTPAGTANSQAFEQHRKENEKWLRKSRKTKPSTLDKVISKTRPRDLPPKERYEDRKHMKEYEDMLAASTQTAKKKAAARQAKQHAREQASAAALTTWEKEILPNWKSVLRRDDLRQIWWSGTMPPRYRSRFWQSCIGNGLVLGKTSYAKALALAKSLENSGKFPQDVIDSIRTDVKDILPQAKLFQSGFPLHNDIVELLQALCVFWKSEKPVHRTGTTWLAGMLLVCMPAQEAFLCLVNLINKSLLKTFYYGSKEDIEAYYRVFNTLLADKMPKVYRNFVAHDIRPSLYLQDWLTTLFSRHLGLETVTRVWDVFVLEGDQFLYRFALGLLQILEARLFNPDHAQLTELCRGEDKGAKVIVAREQNKPEEEVMAWEVYEEMGATEEPIFEVVKAMEWKEATFQRLLTRELPDADA